MWPLTTIYVHNILHRSYGEAGLVLLFQSSAGILGQLAGGALFHRLGAKRLIVGSLLLTGLALLCLIVAKSWIPYICAMTVVGFLMSVTMPAVNAFIGFRWREQQVRLFNVVYVANNIGVALGTSLAGLLAAISFNLTFALNGLSTILFGGFFYVFLSRTDIGDADALQVSLSPHSEELSTRKLLTQYHLYLFVALGLMMIWFSTSAWTSSVAPYLNQKGMSLTSYSFLWTINGLVILVGQPVTTVLNRFITKSLNARLIASGLLYAACFTYMFAFHGSYVYFMIGMVLGTFGEMLINPTIPALITRTTGSSAPFYLGVVGGFGSLGRLVGPVLFGNIFDVWGLTPILGITAVATVLATVLFMINGTQQIRHKRAVNTVIAGASTIDSV